MPSPFDNLDGYREPPLFQPPSWREWLLVLAVAVIVIAAVASVKGEEAEKPITLWIYTAHGDTDAECWCGPCNLQHKSFKKPPLNKFKIIKLDPGEYDIPCIYYHDAKGKWQRYEGWGRGSETEFISQWRRDTKR